jgi:hypothetical protein
MECRCGVLEERCGTSSVKHTDTNEPISVEDLGYLYLMKWLNKTESLENLLVIQDVG